MNIEHTITGWTVVSDIIENTMVTRKYQGYSDEECKEMFLSEFTKNREYSTKREAKAFGYDPGE